MTFNVLVMALGFVIVAGVAFFQANGLAGLFAPAAGFLTLIATVLGALRNALVGLLEDLAV